MNNKSFRIFTAMNNKINRGYNHPDKTEENSSNERRKDHIVFFICIIIAATFWFLIKLSDVYPVSYSLHVKYTHTPKGFIITSLKDSSVTIHFKSDGYNLLDLLIHRDLDTLSIDLSQNEIKRLSDKSYSISTAVLHEEMGQILGVNDRDIDFSKPRLVFYMEKLYKVKRKVAPRLFLSFKSQYRLYDYKVVPSKIFIYGSKQLIDTMRFVYTEKIHLENLNSSKQLKVKIENPFPDKLKFYPSEVKLYLDVEKYTERSIQIPVDVSNIHPAIRTFPLNVNVNFNVFIRDYEKVQPSQFKIVPNVKNINLTKVKQLRLEIKAAPKKVSNIRIVPPEVEFIIINQ